MPGEPGQPAADLDGRAAAHTGVRIDYVPSLDDWKQAYDFIHFEGFLGARMSLQFSWQGSDSALAAPLVLDLALLLAGDKHRVVLLGDGQAGKLAKSLTGVLGVEAASDLERGAPLTDLTGRTGLREAAAILAACAGFVGNDSGLMHLAAALGVPTVGIFGSSNPGWTSPLGPRTAAVVADGYACRPCYRKTCNQPRFCLEDVSGARVPGIPTSTTWPGRRDWRRFGHSSSGQSR